MMVHLNPAQGTYLHLPLDVDVSDWVRSQQIAQDELASLGDAQELLGDLRAQFFYLPKPLSFMTGSSLPAAYHAWLVTGADGSSTWLKGCVMCPVMDLIDDYPQVAARAMLLHEYIARSMGCLVANVTLHIPVLSLPQYQIRELSPATRLWVQQERLLQQQVIAA